MPTCKTDQAYKIRFNPRHVRYIAPTMPCKQICKIIHVKGISWRDFQYHLATTYHTRCVLISHPTGTRAQANSIIIGVHPLTIRVETSINFKIIVISCRIHSRAPGELNTSFSFSSIVYPWPLGYIVAHVFILPHFFTPSSLVLASKPSNWQARFVKPSQFSVSPSSKGELTHRTKIPISAASRTRLVEPELTLTHAATYLHTLSCRLAFVPIVSFDGRICRLL